MTRRLYELSPLPPRYLRRHRRPRALQRRRLRHYGSAQQLDIYTPRGQSVFSDHLGTRILTIAADISCHRDIIQWSGVTSLLTAVAGIEKGGLDCVVEAIPQMVFQLTNSCRLWYPGDKVQEGELQLRAVLLDWMPSAPHVLQELHNLAELPMPHGKSSKSSKSYNAAAVCLSGRLETQPLGRGQSCSCQQEVE
jgi:hypothetical protein